jgi:hypothetical protein
MANKKSSPRLIIDKLLVSFGVVAATGLLILGGLVWWGSNFVTQNVKNELSSQKIFFPPKGSAGLNPTEFPGLQQYAGQLVDNGIKAKAYANEFIGVHLEKIAGGKTYAEVSAMSQADPTNAGLKAQAQTLFQGETLRGLLLGDAYAFWTVGQISHDIALTLVGLGIVMVVLSWFGVLHIMMSRSFK